jgi:hypothetical protein
MTNQLDKTRIESMQEARILIHEVVEILGRAHHLRIGGAPIDPQLIRQARDLAMEARSTLTAQLSLEGDVEVARAIARQVRS